MGKDSKRESKSKVASAPKKKEKAKGAGIHSIRIRLLSAFAVPIICLIVLGVTSYYRASEIVVNNSVDTMNQTIFMMSEYYRSSLEYIQTKVNVFYTPLVEYVDGKYESFSTAGIQLQNSNRTSMKDVVRNDTDINGIYIITPKAPPICTHGYEDEGMYAGVVDTAMGQEMQAKRVSYHWFGKNAEIDKALGVEEGSYIFRFGMSFLNEDAFLIGEITEDLILEIMEKLDFGEGSIMGMVSHDGTEIAYVDGQSIVNGGYFTDKLDFTVEAATEEEGEETVVKEEEPVYVEFDGETYLFLENDVMPGDLKVCVLVPEKNLLDETLVIRNMTVILVIVAVVLSMIIGIGLSNNISGVIKKINKHLDKIANGDLTGRLKMKGKDEFAILADRVNNMADNVANLVGEVRQIGGKLLGIVQNVADTTNHFVESTTVIKTSVKEIEEGINQLDVSSTNSLSQMDILSSQFEQLNSNASSIGKATDCTVETINESLKIMHELNEKTSDTTAMMGKVSSTMELLETKISEINDIVNAIDDIASQTTLLSLNASIEAARAGEAGMGFSVVADEIRKLADQSLLSADEIRKIIGEITQQTKVAGQSVDNACDSVENQKSAVEKTTSSFHMMDEQTRILTEQIREILEYVTAMENARTTTEDAIQTISAASSQTAASSVEVYNTAEAQSTEAVNLKQATEQMLSQANQLEDAIQKFKV